MNIKRFMNRFILLIIILLFGITLNNYHRSLTSNNGYGYEYLYMVPTIFLSSLLIFDFKKTIKNPALLMILGILSLKYLITPVLMIYTDNFSGTMNFVETSFESRRSSVNMFIFNMSVTLIFLKVLLGNDRKVEQLKTRSYGLNSTVILISIFIGVISLVVFPNIMDNLTFLIFGRFKDMENRNSLVTILTYFSTYIQVFIFLLIIKHSIKKEKKVSTTLLILLGFTMNTAILWNTNRMTIIINAITSFMMIISIFPSYFKRLFIPLIMVTSVMVVSLTGYRYLGDINADIGEIFDVFNSKTIANHFQLYFSGPDGLAATIEMNNSYHNFDLESFITDTFTGVNFIREFSFISSNYEKTSVYLYNMTAAGGYNTGLIIPIEGQSFVYFGYIFSPLLLLVYLYLYRVSYNKLLRSKDLGIKYAFLYLTINLAFSPIYNHTIVVQNIFNRFIPLMIIVLINSKVRSITR